MLRAENLAGAVENENPAGRRWRLVGRREFQTDGSVAGREPEIDEHCPSGVVVREFLDGAASVGAIWPKAAGCEESERGSGNKASRQWGFNSLLAIESGILDRMLLKNRHSALFPLP